METETGSFRRRLLLQFDMATIIDRNLALISYWSNFGGCPLDIDPVTRSASMPRSKLKWFVFATALLMTCFAGTYQTGVLLWSMFDKSLFVLEHFAIQITAVTAHWLGIGIGLKFFVAEYKANLYFMNDALAFYKDSSIRRDMMKYDSSRRKPSVSIQRFILWTCPVAFPFLAISIMIMVLSDCRRVMLLYYLYDQKGMCMASKENFAVYLVSAAFQIAMTNFSCSFSYLCIYLHLLGVGYLNDRMSENCRWYSNITGQRSAAKLTTSIANLRHQALRVRIFNVVNSGTVFYMKETELWISVLSWCTAISFYSRNLVSATFSSVVGLYGTTAYPVTYAKAYKIPKRVLELKRQMLADASLTPQYGLIRRQLRAIRAEGVRVGSFGIIDRMTGPDFVRFCSTQVATFLITFRS